MTKASKIGMIIGCIMTPIFILSFFAYPGEGGAASHAGTGLQIFFYFPIPIMIAFMLPPVLLVVPLVLAFAQFPFFGWLLGKAPPEGSPNAKFGLLILKALVGLHVVVSLAVLALVGAAILGMFK